MLCDGRGSWARPPNTIRAHPRGWLPIVGLRLFQGGVVAGGKGEVGVRVVRDSLVVPLNGSDEYGEVLLVQAFFAGDVDALELKAALLVFGDHLYHLTDAPMPLSRSIEGCQALLNARPEALVMLHLRKISGEVPSDEPREEDQVTVVKPQTLARLVEGLLRHLVQDVVRALKLESLLRGLQRDLVLCRRSSVHLLQVDRCPP